MFAIEINHISKRYKGAAVPALNDLSFTVQRNSVMGLLGPNGAGKTTAISIICGLTKPDSGSAIVLGRDGSGGVAATRRLIGMAPQRIALFANLTAMENFRYIGRLYGLDKNTIEARAGSLLARLGLEKQAGKRIGAFSGGMKRRANIIASLMHEPELLILDEPTAGVDVQSRAMILGFLKEYSRQNKTIVYTSHQLEEAEQICDEVVIIDEGRFIVSGTPQQLVKDAAGCKRLEDVFLHYTGHTARDTE